MLPSIQDIQQKLSTHTHPLTNQPLDMTKDIQQLVYEADKLLITFSFAKTASKDFSLFQRQLLSSLKVELGIPKVQLNFQIASTKPTFILPSHQQSKFIAIASGKGGVGKSTVTVGIAQALQKLGKKVAIIDADIYGASIPQILKLNHVAPQVVDGKVKPFVHETIELISSSLLIRDNKPVMWKGPMLSKLLKQFFIDVAWSNEIEYFLIDMPPGTGDIMLELHHILPQAHALVVTTPQEDAAYVATKAGLALLDLEIELLGIIENMSYVECEHCHQKTYVFGQSGGAYVSEALSTPLIDQIPLYPIIQSQHFTGTAQYVIDYYTTPIERSI